MNGINIISQDDTLSIAQQIDIQKVAQVLNNIQDIISENINTVQYKGICQSIQQELNNLKV